MYEEAGCCGALILLGYLSACDIRMKKIPVSGVLISGILAVLYILAGGNAAVSYFSGCMLPGMVFLLLSLITKERIGYGDGAAMMVLGLWTGGTFCIITVFISIFLSGIYALCLLITGRNKTLIPYMPFLLAAMEVVLLYE